MVNAKLVSLRTNRSFAFVGYSNNNDALRLNAFFQ